MSVITPENNVVFEYLDGIAKEFKVNWTSPLSASPGPAAWRPPATAVGRQARRLTRAQA